MAPYTLRNTKGVSVRDSELGAALVSWITPDRDGFPGETLLGHDTPGEYLAAGAYMGALVGRWANRIEAARFSLNGVEYPLIPNEGQSLLHGGVNGFHRILWESEQDGDSVIMRLDSPEGVHYFHFLKRPQSGVCHTIIQRLGATCFSI
ncbi:aldose epimerase family protein [Paraburkholderia nemoris]|uniref:aldose epimerase family protein n=1 Tax=Paraburkholderia nemoris TaxID=2793076 RepID=UPI0038BD130B